jgi:phage gpG-like protein
MPIKQNFSLVKRQVEFNKMLRQLPNIIGNTAMNYYKKSFTYQGWNETGSSVDKWDEREPNPRQTPAQKKYENKAGKRNVLVQTGRLWRSIRIISQDARTVRVGTDVPYARIHNEGGVVNRVDKVRAHTRKGKDKTAKVRVHSRTMKYTMPRRKFMGASTGLNAKIAQKIMERMKKIGI